MASKSIPPKPKECKKEPTLNKTSESFVTKSELEEMFSKLLRILDMNSRRLSNLEREVSHLYGYDERSCCENTQSSDNLQIFELKQIKGLPLDYESIRNHFRSLDI